MLFGTRTSSASKAFLKSWTEMKSDRGLCTKKTFKIRPGPLGSNPCISYVSLWRICSLAVLETAFPLLSLILWNLRPPQALQSLSLAIPNQCRRGPVQCSNRARNNPSKLLSNGCSPGWGNWTASSAWQSRFMNAYDLRHLNTFWYILPVVPHKAVAEVSRIGNV